MANQTLLPILNFLLLPNYGSVFHLTNIINDFNTKDVVISNFEYNNHKASEIIEHSLKYTRNYVAVTVIQNFNADKNLLKDKSSAIFVVLYNDFYKVLSWFIEEYPDIVTYQFPGFI